MGVGLNYGDIIFTQTLIRNIAEEGRILWGVESSFVDGLIRAYPDIFFLDKNLLSVDYNRKEQYSEHGAIVIPIRWADTNARVPYNRCMEIKYTTYGYDWQDWRKKAMWTRNIPAENSLFSMLGLVEGQQYTLVNRFFGSQSQFAAQILVNGIEMLTMPNYSLFDWAKVIENASAIHTASTSIIYLLELLDLKAPEIHLYPRKPITDHFRDVDYILQKHKYIFHE